MTSTRKLLAAWALIFSLLLPTLSLAVEQAEVTGQISEINYEQQTLSIDVLDAGAERLSNDVMALAADFSRIEGACIDWSSEQNRGLSVFFSLEKGDIIKSHVLIEEEVNKASGLADISESFWTDLTKAGKLFPPTLIEAFQTPGAQVNIVVSLGAGEKESENPAPSIFETLSDKDFIFKDKTQNTPIVSGMASLSGLIKLIKSPEVLSIEENLDMQLLAPAGEIR